MMMTQWNRVQGSISTMVVENAKITTFRIGAQAYDGGPTWQQRVDVSTDRLTRYPNLYREILDRMVYDIAKHVER